MVTLHAARNEFVAFQVLVRGDPSAGTIQPDLKFDGAAAEAVKVEFGRYHPVMSRRGPLPDPIVPLGYPQPDEMPTAKSQSLHVEVYIPHDLPAGKHSGTLTLTRW